MCNKVLSKIELNGVSMQNSSPETYMGEALEWPSEMDIIARNKTDIAENTCRHEDRKWFTISDQIHKHIFTFCLSKLNLSQ